MLVLGRNEGQSIKIGRDIVVTIISNRDGHVRVGIDAPTHIKVLRSELEKNNRLDNDRLDAVKSNKLIANSKF